MSPELFNTIKGMQNMIISVMEDMGNLNYGNAALTLRQMYAQLAVQSSMLNIDLDEMDGNTKQIVDCVLTDAQLEAELGGCK